MAEWIGSSMQGWPVWAIALVVVIIVAIGFLYSLAKALETYDISGFKMPWQRKRKK